MMSDNFHVLYLNGRTDIHLQKEKIESTRVKLIIEPGAIVTIFDDRRHDTEQMNLAIEVIALENARVTYKDQQKFLNSATVKSTVFFKAEQDAYIYGEQRQSNAQNIEMTISAFLLGNNAEIQMRAGDQLRDAQTQKVMSYQYHKASYTKSNCLVRTALDDKAKAFYEGTIVIDKNAYASEAFQNHKSILLSDDAFSYARPSIEVHTDDVQCGHGSAIGELDAEHLFYLQSRGIDKMQARSLLLGAFFDDLFESKREIERFYE